jgi:hypothetical protein
MFLFHYILPLIIFYFYREKIIFFGLLLGNLVDLDHVYYRIIGKVEWFGSACAQLGDQCSWGTYPLHNWTFVIIFSIFSGLIFTKNKKLRFIGWLSIGALLNFALDYIHALTGFGI